MGSHRVGYDWSNLAAAAAAAGLLETICSSLLEDRLPPLGYGVHLFRCTGGGISPAHCSTLLNSASSLGLRDCLPRLGRNADSRTQLQFCKQPSPPERSKLKASCDTKHVLYWHQILLFQLLFVFLFVSHLTVILPPAERSALKGSRPSVPVPPAAGAALRRTGVVPKGCGHYCWLTMAGVQGSSWMTDLISMHWGYFQQQI